MIAVTRNIYQDLRLFLSPITGKALERNALSLLLWKSLGVDGANGKSSLER
jgi:hypothetical protein